MMMTLVHTGLTTRCYRDVKCPHRLLNLEDNGENNEILTGFILFQL